MARTRNIKPAFFQNENMAELDPLARLFFIGLWTVADFKGEFEWRPKRLAIQILPYEDLKSTVQLLDKYGTDLKKSGFVRYYSNHKNPGVLYCHIVNFTKHQHPHQNESKVKNPLPAIGAPDSQLIDFVGFSEWQKKDQYNSGTSIGVVPDNSESDPALYLTPYTLNTTTTTGPQSIPDNYTPGAETLEALEKFHGIPPGYVAEQIIEFRTYWKDRGESKQSWDSAFLKSCSGQWQQYGHKWSASNEISNGTTRKTRLAEATTGDERNNW